MGSILRVQDEVQHGANMGPSWASTNRFWSAHGPPRAPQKGPQLGPHKIIFLRPKLGSILGGSWRPQAATEHFFGGPRAKVGGLLEYILKAFPLLGNRKK